MAVRPRLGNIQGNVVPGFNSPHQAFLLARFPDGAAARAWLAELLPEVTSAQEVLAFLERRERLGRRPETASALWANVGLSWLGLQLLGADSLDEFPEEFRQGLYARAERLGDGPAEQRRWEVGGSADTEAHALLVLATGEAAHLDREQERQKARLLAHGVSEGALWMYRGARLEGALKDREHFGFNDAVSQPVLDVEGPLAPAERPGDLSQPGEFILGYLDEHGRREALPAWTRDGSYVVFRRLRQDVFAFRQTVAREAARVALRPEKLAASLIGRWPSGAKIRSPFEGADPGVGNQHRVVIQPAEFRVDPEGMNTPRFAHIRKAYPRDVPSAEPQRHRLLRRGIPYGRPLAPDAQADDGVDRGLLFLAYQASLARQFEHVQRQFFNNVDFPRRGDGPDPLVGEPGVPREVRISRGGGREAAVRLNRFVSTTAGGYFFAPSIAALAQLAGDGAQRALEKEEMDYESYVQLAQFVASQNPYASEVQLRPGWQATTPIEECVVMGQVGVKPDGMAAADFERRWRFRGADLQIARALRICYDYRDGAGHLLTRCVLIGFEGDGGP